MPYLVKLHKIPKDPLDLGTASQPTEGWYKDVTKPEDRDKVYKMVLAKSSATVFDAEAEAIEVKRMYDTYYGSAMVVEA